MQVKLTAKQTTDNGSIELPFIAEFTNASKSKVLGTLLNELFEFQKIACKHRTGRFMSNEVTDISFSVGEITFDSSAILRGENKVLKMFRAKLRLRNNPKSRKDFATLVNDIIDYMCREVYEISFDELIEKLDAELLEFQLSKDIEKFALN